MVVVLAVQVYNNNFSVSNVIITIRGNKKSYLEARGRNAPEPIIIVIVTAAIAAATGLVAVAASSDPWWAAQWGVVLGHCHAGAPRGGFLLPPSLSVAGVG